MEIQRTTPQKWLIGIALLASFFLLGFAGMLLTEPTNLIFRSLAVILMIAGFTTPVAAFVAIEEVLSITPRDLTQDRASDVCKTINIFWTPFRSQEFSLEDYQSVRVYEVDHWFSFSGLMTAVACLLLGMVILALSFVLPFFLFIFLFAPFFRFLPIGLIGAVRKSASAVNIAGSLCHPVVISEGPLSRDESRAVALAVSAVTGLRVSGLKSLTE